MMLLPQNFTDLRGTCELYVECLRVTREFLAREFLAREFLAREFLTRELLASFSLASCSRVASNS